MIQLQFSTDSEGWVEELCNGREATIKVMSVKAQDSRGSVTHFVDISSESATAEDITQELKKSRRVTDTDLARVGANRVIGSVTSVDDGGVCKALVESNTNTFIAPACTEEHCQMVYKLFVSGNGLPIFLQKLHDGGVVYKIGDLSPLSSEKGLTARQQKILRSALELGYYDFPKRISTIQLADAIGIKAGTVSEILRRAEKNVISTFFEVGAKGA